MILINLQTKVYSSSVLCISVIQFSINAVNFIVILRMTAKNLQIYCWDILIWATQLFYLQWLFSTVQTSGENEEFTNDDELIICTQYSSTVERPVIFTRVWDDDTSTVLHSVHEQHQQSTQSLTQQTHTHSIHTYTNSSTSLVNVCHIYTVSQKKQDTKL